MRIKLDERRLSIILANWNWFIRMAKTYAFLKYIPHIFWKILKIWYRWHVARNIFAYEMHQINYLVRCKREIYWHGFRHFEFCFIKTLFGVQPENVRLNSDIHSRVYEEFCILFFFSYNNIVVRLSHGVHLLSEM